MKELKLVLLLTLAMLGSTSAILAQTTVKGYVIDGRTRNPMAMVSVYFEGGRGVITGEDGSYLLQSSKKNLKNVVFSFTGYKKLVKPIKFGEENIINVELEEDDVLNEVVVKSTRRSKYRNKNNPAVELIDLVIQNKEKNRITAYDYVQYQQYEKLVLSLTNKPEKLMNNSLFRKYKFIIENIDSTSIPGKYLLPFYLTEQLAEKYYSKNPERNKTVVKAEKKVNFGDFIDNGGIQEYLKALYNDVNIYENNVNILTTQFLSPIADMGPTFYRYYIRDTTVIDGIKVVKLYFTPRNNVDLLFKGIMYITLDGNYGVQRISMTVSENANLNWARNLKINQDFERSTIDNRYHVTKSSMFAELSLTQNSSGAIFGERTVSFKDFVFNQAAPDSIYKGADLVIKQNPAAAADSFWLANRHDSLPGPQAKTYANIDSLRNMKSFKRFTDVVMFLFSGYISFGKWELGNTNTFYSFNPVEGFKLRVGGRTTPKFSELLYFDHYASYGFKDKQLKYLVGATYSFNKKSIYSFPLNYLRISYQYDTKIPGQELLFVQEDNFFLSFKRGNNNKWLYNNYLKAEYIREFGKNLSYNITFKNWKQQPAGDITYQKVSDNSFVNSITTSEISAELRWAPNEQFYQGKNYRIPIINKYPIFKVRVIKGLKGVMNGEYDYTNVTFRFDKRFYLSQFGNLDATVEAGYIFGKLPYPLLTIHRANQTYAYQLNSYNMMNFLEFTSDRFVTSTLDFHFNGFFLNKLPLIKKLKLREVASFKILVGGVRAENHPDSNPEMFKFPVDGNNQQITYALDKTPYMEASVGVANIFKLVRVDFVKRLTYLNHPDILEYGIRTRIRFDF